MICFGGLSELKRESRFKQESSMLGLDFSRREKGKAALDWIGLKWWNGKFDEIKGILKQKRITTKENAFDFSSSVFFCCCVVCYARRRCTRRERIVQFGWKSCDWEKRNGMKKMQKESSLWNKWTEKDERKKKESKYTCRMVRNKHLSFPSFFLRTQTHHSIHNNDLLGKRNR